MEDIRSELDGHVRECAECQVTLAFWTRVVNAGVSALEVNVPEEVRQSAVSLFPSRPTGEGLSIPRLLARLLYDTWQTPVVEGVRSAAREARQGVFRAGRYSVDLRLEQMRDGRWRSLLGQVSDELNPEATIASVPISLIQGDTTIVGSHCNEHGEFSIVYEVVPGLSLVLRLPEAEVAVPLTNFDLEQ